jgi:hypothetical protein
MLPLDMSVVQRTGLPLDVSVLQQPCADAGRVCYTEDYAASGHFCPTAVLCCIWMCLSCSSLVLTLDVSVIQKIMLPLDMSALQQFCAAYGCVCPTAACAAPVRVCSTAACAASVRVCSIAACAAPGPCTCLFTEVFVIHGQVFPRDVCPTAVVEHKQL